MHWQYDEFHPVGRDYGRADEAGIYDASHADFRDLEAESESALDRLAVMAGEVLVDFGAGTGTFAICAARRTRPRGGCFRGHAGPGACESRGRARHRVSSRRFPYLRTPRYARGHRSASFAFHHLPDFWKGIALQRIHTMLRPGGRLYLHDVILESPAVLANIQTFIDAQAAAGGDFLRDDAEGHFRDEFSTYDWVMDGLLERAGFAIRSKEIERGVLGTYFCEKPVTVDAEGAPASR